MGPLSLCTCIISVDETRTGIRRKKCGYIIRLSTILVPLAIVVIVQTHSNTRQVYGMLISTRAVSLLYKPVWFGWQTCWVSRLKDLSISCQLLRNSFSRTSTVHEYGISISWNMHLFFVVVYHLSITANDYSMIMKCPPSTIRGGADKNWIAIRYCPGWTPSQYHRSWV